MKKLPKFSAEVPERTVRVAQEHRAHYDSLRGGQGFSSSSFSKSPDTPAPTRWAIPVQKLG